MMVSVCVHVPVHVCDDYTHVLSALQVYFLCVHVYSIHTIVKRLFCVA